jgi:hypothetical protein
MKLYTEEQVRQMLFDLGDVLFNNCQNGIGEEEPETYFDGIIEQLTPIELPSDEEIEKAYEFLGTWTAKEIMQRSTSFQHGAKWVIEQIKQQDKNNS